MIRLPYEGAIRTEAAIGNSGPPVGRPFLLNSNTYTRPGNNRKGNQIEALSADQTPARRLLFRPRRGQGISAFLYGTERKISQVSQYLFTPGCWLVLIEFTVVRFGWTFSFKIDYLVIQVIFTIGASMREQSDVR
jgi:hypothetical protein